jgi:hypothetical protein
LSLSRIKVPNFELQSSISILSYSMTNLAWVLDTDMSSKMRSLESLLPILMALDVKWERSMQ